MKNILKIMSVIFLFVTSSLSYGWSIGAHGGLNFSSATSDSASGVQQVLSSKTYFVGGGFGELEINSLLNLRLEGNYVKRGSATSNVTTTFDYFEVPLLLVLRLDLPIVKPFVLVGPQMGFLSKATATPNSSGVASNASGYKSTDVGLNIGVGADLTLAPFLALELELRYYMGLADINDTSGVYKNRGLMGMVGIVFGI